MPIKEELITTLPPVPLRLQVCRPKPVGMQLSRELQTLRRMEVPSFPPAILKPLAAVGWLNVSPCLRSKALPQLSCCAPRYFNSPGT